eukprot:8896329-Pyramimonas_sp.AAC.1
MVPVDIKQTHPGLMARMTISMLVRARKRTSRDRPIRRRKRGYILTTDQSDAGDAGIFSRRTNRTQEARAYSRDRPTEYRGCLFRTVGLCEEPHSILPLVVV